jgi:hypothetical protein
MVKSLLYILKLSTVSVVALIGGRFLGIYLAGIIQDVGIVWNFSSIGGMLNPVVPIESVKNIMTFADMFMYAVLSVGMSIVLIRSVFLHDENLNVPVISRLADKGVFSLIKSTYHLYHWSIVWMVFLIMGSIIVAVDAFEGRADTWVAVVTSLFSVFSFIILIKDTFNEIETAKSLVPNKS